jgi:hypothetical protein
MRVKASSGLVNDLELTRHGAGWGLVTGVELEPSGQR